MAQGKKERRGKRKGRRERKGKRGERTYAFKVASSSS